MNHFTWWRLKETDGYHIYSIDLSIFLCESPIVNELFDINFLILNTMSPKELHMYKQENNFEQFYKKIAALVPELKNFMTGSLKATENQGLLDRGFYSTDEMLDEVYLEAFNAFSAESDIIKLRRSLFKKAIQKIEGKKAE